MSDRYPERDWGDWHEPDGRVKWCDAPGPTTTRTNRDGETVPYTIRCADIIGHRGDHENGTYRWPAGGELT